MKTIFIALFVILTQSSIGQSMATVETNSNTKGWQKLGDVTASFNLDNESIMVVSAGKIKSIRLKVLNASITIQTLYIYYESGEIETVILKSMLTPGAETKPIDLKKGSAFKKVVFTYNSVPNENKENAQIELYGHK